MSSLLLVARDQEVRDEGLVKFYRDHILSSTCCQFLATKISLVLRIAGKR